MPYTLHLNVGYSDNHQDWVHFQTETGEQPCEPAWLPIDPHDSIEQRAVALDAHAQMVLDERGIQQVLFP